MVILNEVKNLPGRQSNEVLRFAHDDKDIL